MITINGIDVDFDITSPSDILRLDTISKSMADRTVPDPPTNEKDPGYLTKYVAWLNEMLNMFGNFIDDLFGDGIAEKLLTNNPSLTKMFDVNDALEEALGRHVQQITARFEKYRPNRATRRAQK